MNKILQRSIYTAATLHVREAAEGESSRVIEGYALKFGVRSRLLCDGWELYYEVLEPGSVTREMLDRQDIKLTIFHNRQLILARSKAGSGTLNYDVDETGVRFWAEMPNTADGDKALELVKRGDIDGCSFMYSTDEMDSEHCVTYETIEEDGEDVLLRHVKRIDRVYDFTITPDPAYEQTEVTRRDMESARVQLAPKPEPKAPKVDEARKRENVKKLRESIKSRLI
ncbi:MAG: HK97 family phage prohead protease [Bacteroidales bacterium]|nr:HK97 family phage prohead protease [Bacteroidales bacterium]MBR7051607.1 HK97 family phage prohead protease [Bacteroidaceae bacterium]